ncbi:MAG TPA: HTTM domain-containing protein [Chthoniobacterales bacterium]|nr:HTTM domain-containing protein [Chthoniobacterales bacterium]
MKVRINQLDEPNCTTSQRQRRSLCVAAAIALGGSLLLLLGAGWLQNGGSKLAISGFGALLLSGALVGIFRTLDFSTPRLVNGTPRQLAWIRIVVCLTALIYTLMEDLPAIASIPAGMRSDDQFFHVLNSLPGYSTLLSSPYLLGTLQWTTAALLFLGLIGFLMRPTLFLGGLGFFLIQAILRQYTYFFHSGVLVVYLALLLAWTPCAATWSVDQWLNPQKRRPSAQSIGFSVYACFTVMAVIYLLCGLSKMRDSGLDWFRGDNIEHKLVQDALSPIFFDYKWKATIWLVQHHAPDYVFAIIGAVGLIVELGYVTVLFSRTAQIIMPIAALGVHVGILVFQHILFPDLLLLQLIFLNVDWFAAFSRRNVRAKDEVTRGQSDDNKSGPPLSYVPTTAIALVLAVFLVAWVWRVEYYPLSAWHMYSNPERKGPFWYFKIVATLENGSSIVIPTRDFSPALLPNARYILARVFLTTRRNEIFEQFLASYVQRRNRNLAFGSPISSMEVQRWRWNYVVDPNDPRFGWVTGVYPYDVPSKPSSSR